MMLEAASHGFQHISDVMSVNAIVTLFFFVLAIVSAKVTVTLISATVRDDAALMDWYQRTVEGKDLPRPVSQNGNDDHD
ncbi:hypothetical protein [Acidihalobacter ferrooxydans]|uniref:Uncharacterized protein n=1 Tax=Acidihalobacter ferrooxydans TaxID=1765967 RepID=A0A1P8UDR6_9GAMM|nr:hypothetical protein [Acidihalobacter ferrooxydans]APZ41946.1 hypothetical protein BW247_01570 [Acidihalobacter ferrooxydans]